ncbi:amidohydrolase family protein [Flavobacterium sp. NRK F7]|uniref:amidohydrolase family protein n=1 Tax=Flavobacterium sp. NRK F7 TaxID=2954930 RepID=UPI002091C572|nr:amidohydrolase family protein [Flavobacterium sp. NRK F7]MCO6162862.1 amidohydrolase family protein [Flavobacterium sp. NRK F7]
MKKYIFLLAVSCFAFGQQTPAPKQTQTILITGGKAHLGNGKVIENSIISIKEGKIAMIQDGTNFKPEKHDIYIDASKKHIYPGFIGANATLGLVEIDAVKASDDESEMGEMNPHIRSIIAYNTESGLVEAARPNGVLLAQIAPRGGRISGTSSVVQLDAWNWEDAVIKENDGIHLSWPRSFSRSGWWAEPGGIEPNKNYDKQVTEIQDFFNDAKAYFLANPAVRDIPYEAMKGLDTGEKTLFVHVDGEKEIVDAIVFKKKNNIQKMTLVGGYYAFKNIPLLKENNVSVLLRRVHDLPLLEDEDVNLPYKNAKLLDDAGILVGLQNAGDMERMQIRNLPFYAGTCVAWGMEKERALQLITSNTAKILGIETQYGSLEVGKSATLFISEGDALDITSNQVTQAFIDGRNISLESHQTELYDRYKEKFDAQNKK